MTEKLKHTAWIWDMEYWDGLVEERSLYHKKREEG